LVTPDTGSAQTLPWALSGLFGAWRGEDLGLGMVRLQLLGAASCAASLFGDADPARGVGPAMQRLDGDVSCTYLACAQALVMRAATRERGSK
jgi:hypothetical protein